MFTFLRAIIFTFCLEYIYAAVNMVANRIFGMWFVLEFQLFGIWCEYSSHFWYRIKNTLFSEFWWLFMMGLRILSGYHFNSMISCIIHLHYLHIYHRDNEMRLRGFETRSHVKYGIKNGNLLCHKIHLLFETGMNHYSPPVDNSNYNLSTNQPLDAKRG